MMYLYWIATGQMIPEEERPLRLKKKNTRNRYELEEYYNDFNT